MEKKNILLTGASGTVGQEVLKQLVLIPDIQLYLSDIEIKKLKQLKNLDRRKTIFVSGDLTKEKDIQKIPSGLSIVIHLAAIIPPAADKNPALTRKINVDGTRYLINHIKKTSPNAFFLYSSSVSVYGDRVQNSDIYVSDNLKISEGDIYGQSKMDAETIVKNSKLSWTIFRLAAIMKNHKMTKLMFHMPLDTKLEICTPEDTARAFVNAIYHIGELEGKIFNLGGGEKCCISYQDFLQRSFKIFGLGKLNFPKFAFAERNFHCGFYADGDVLENVLHFRKDTMDSYFKKTAGTLPRVKKILATLFSPLIKLYLLSLSEPYKAYKKNDKKMMKHFFRKVEQTN